MNGNIDDILEAIRKGRTILEDTRKVEMIGGKISDEGVLKASSTFISFEEEGFKTLEVQRVYRAKCGHLNLDDSSQVAGQCGELGCGAWVCTKCMRQCQQCRKPLCPEHQYNDNQKVLCLECRLGSALPFLSLLKTMAGLFGRR